MAVVGFSRSDQTRITRHLKIQSHFSWQFLIIEAKIWLCKEILHLIAAEEWQLYLQNVAWQGAYTWHFYTWQISSICLTDELRCIYFSMQW